MPILKRFQEDDIVKANATEVTAGLWPGDVGELTSFHTGSQAGETSGEFYWDVYDADPDSDPEANPVFAIAYGHIDGAGHPTLLDDPNSTLAPKAVYSQYRNLLLDPGNPRFTFAGGHSPDYIYVINIERYLIKERLDAGNWKLTLEGPGGDDITLIDDSGQALGSAFGRSGKVFNVVIGELGGSQGSIIIKEESDNNGGFGLFYPSKGLIVLNPDALDEEIDMGLPVTTPETAPQFNQGLLFDAIEAGGSFFARSAENISSTHYFVRMRASEFNYSNNPTFFDEVNGAIKNVGFIQDPRVYITTIGLYNDNNEMLAVAKTTQPIQKAFDREINLKVRLDFVMAFLAPAAAWMMSAIGM